MTTPALLAAAAGTQGERLPVWFMRQAGRSLPEYRELRQGKLMLETCADPAAVIEITLQPVRRHHVDAAILYSDIMVPLKAIGFGVDIVPGVGPVIENPIRTRADLEQLRPLEPGDVDYISVAVKGLVAELGEVPLIGFAGAPFTVASYLVEGGPSKDHAATQAMMAAEPELWNELCARLAAISGTFLAAQVAAGARAVQLFDSWAGSLSVADYRAQVLPHSAATLAQITDVPRIHFGVGTGEVLTDMASIADVIGVDWRIGLDVAAARVGGNTAVQGNLDPALLRAPWPVIADRMRGMIRAGAAAPGHIVNLGHGVPPDADPGVLTRIADLVHEEGPQLRAKALAR